jgi:hypothetical protein
LRFAAEFLCELVLAMTQLRDIGKRLPHLPSLATAEPVLMERDRVTVPEEALFKPVGIVA